MTNPTLKPGGRFQQAELDRKSLALHRLSIQKILRDPRLLQRVQENLDRWCRPGQTLQPHFVAWQALVVEGMEMTLVIALEESERGQVLRQASPFAGILAEADRLGFLKAWPLA